MEKNIIIGLFSFFIVSCSNLGEYNYQPLKNVKIKVTLDKISYDSNSGIISTLLYFDYKIIKETNTNIYFNFDSIKVSFNRNISSEIYFNSIASVIPTHKQLQDGENEFNLYAVFSDSIPSYKQNSFKILSYGFVD